LAKIGPVDFEIIGVTGIVKNKKLKQNVQPAGLLSAAVWAKLIHQSIGTYVVLHVLNNANK